MQQRVKIVVCFSECLSAMRSLRMFAHGHMHDLGDGTINFPPSCLRILARRQRAEIHARIGLPLAVLFRLVPFCNLC